MGLKDVVVRVLPKRVISPIIARRMWTNRVTAEGDDHLNLYWDSIDRDYRRMLVDLVDEIVRDSPAPASVLEYGSHVGPNIRLLKERLPANTEYFAVEPNAEATRFLNQKMPDVGTLTADERGFLAAKDMPPHPVTVSLSIGVLYGMSPRAARGVVRKLLATSAAVILAENGDNADGRRSGFIPAHDTFTHPYLTWCRAAGFTDTRIVPFPEGDAHYAMNAFMIARRPR